MTYAAYAKHDLKVIFGNKNLHSGSRQLVETHYENYLKIRRLEPLTEIDLNTPDTGRLPGDFM